MAWISWVGRYSSTNFLPCSRCHKVLFPVFRSPRMTIFTSERNTLSSSENHWSTQPRRRHFRNVTFTATAEDHFPDCLKDSLLYWTPLAKRRCKLWFMDCRPAGMGLSLSCPGSDPTSFLSAENILTRLHELAQQHVVAQWNLPDNSPNNDWRRCVKKKGAQMATEF